jgi:predicted CxxxxCH...CXXCH cytochrome family protein
VRWTLSIVLLLAALPARGLDATDADVDTCVSCHEQEEKEELSRQVPEWREGVHREAGVTCDGCHGGDPREEDDEASMSEEAGYVGKPAWYEIPRFCGECHEEVARSYQEGALGAAIAEGRKPPTCATCHMPDGHRMRSPDVEKILSDQRRKRVKGFVERVRTRKLIVAIHRLERRIDATVAGIDVRGLDTTRLRDRLSGVRDGYIRALHAFEIDRLQVSSLAAHEDLDRIGELADAHLREARFRLRYGLALVTALGALYVVLIRIGRGRIEGGDASGTSLGGGR